MKRRRKETREQSGRIVDEVRAPLNVAIGSAMPSKKACLKSIGRLNNTKGWKIPESLSKLRIPEELKTLEDGTKFFFYHSGTLCSRRCFTRMKSTTIV